MSTTERAVIVANALRYALDQLARAIKRQTDLTAAKQISTSMDALEKALVILKS
jgi:hypothetical protein